VCVVFNCDVTHSQMFCSVAWCFLLCVVCFVHNCVVTHSDVGRDLSMYVADGRTGKWWVCGYWCVRLVQVYVCKWRGVCVCVCVCAIERNETS